ncbi:MAG: NHL repeat-containing protein [Planctomycetota bacterium]
MNPKTGDVYAVSLKVTTSWLHTRGPATVHKISARGKSAGVTAKLTLPARLQHTGMISAFDGTGEKPALWLTGGKALVKVEDRGNSLALATDNLFNPPEAIDFLTYIEVDAEEELVYVSSATRSVWRYDGRTGKGRRVKGIIAPDLAVGPGGMIYTYGDKGSYWGMIGRYTRDLKPAPVKATGSHRFGQVYGRWGRSNSVPGLDVDWRGRTYLFWGQNRCHVRLYDENGARVDLPRKGTVYRNQSRVLAENEPILIDGLVNGGASIRVDLKGNIYVGQKATPKGHVPPRGFRKDVAYSQMVGSVLKFRPEGGAVKYKPRREGGGIASSEGLEKVYPGLSPISGWKDVSLCTCLRPRFDVDGFGRLYVPDAVSYKVRVLDNAGNRILQFGGYGTYDSQGPGSSQPLPKIPTSWPVCALSSDAHIYVGDALNHRVVRADKTWAAEQVCQLR